MSRQETRQFDIQRINNQHLTLPIAVPYRLDATDFPADQYEVVVESPANGSPHPWDRFRDIGRLQNRVELPGIIFHKGFGSSAQIGVLPKKAGLPPFIGNLVRGATYQIIPNSIIITSTGHRALQRTGGVLL